MTSGFDTSAWNTPQIALFEALGEVVDSVGARNAAYLAHRTSSNSPSREFLERMRSLEIDSKLAQEARILLEESIKRFSPSYAASEAEAYQMRLKHLLAKERLLDTLSLDSGFAIQSLTEIGRQYEGTDLHALASTMVDMREKTIMLERALGVEGEEMTPEDMKKKLAKWRVKVWEWDNHATAAAKRSSDAREIEREENAETQVDRGGTDHTSTEPSATLIPISNPASPKSPPNESEVEVKEDRKRQQAKLKKAIDANRLLQAKLRQVSDNRNRWSEYCAHLQKKLERSDALLKEHKIAKEPVKTGGAEEAIIDVMTPGNFASLHALVAAQENLHVDGGTETRQQCVDMTDASGNNTSEEGPSSQAAGIEKNDVLPEFALEPLSPKLPRLLHTTTVPDSLASSSSVSQHHTSSTQAEHPTSGADTINANETNQANTAAACPPPSDDESPIVVSERNIRKRKHNESPPMKKIKQERTGSSPIALLGLGHLQTQESMDLDDIGPKTATPKKRREKQGSAFATGLVEEYPSAQIYPQAPIFGTARDKKDEEEAANPPLPPRSLTSTPSIGPSAASILQPRSTNIILPRTTAKTDFVKRRRISDKGADLFSEDGENHLSATNAEASSYETPSKAVSNAIAGRLAGLMEKPSPRRWQVTNLGDKPGSASASGLASAAQQQKPPTKSTIVPRQTVRGRLAAQHVEARKLVDQGCTGRLRAKGYAGPQDLADLAKSKQSEASDEKRPPRQRSLSNDRVDMSGSETAWQMVDEEEARSQGGFEGREVKHANEVKERGRQRRLQGVSSTARPEEAPLATRPVSGLYLNDFRINPEYNNGLDYAYRDVVRGRDRRKCLAGCIDPSCCGKGFRALADIATPVRDNLTPMEKEEEDRLLTEFLGRDAARLIKHMGKEERRETLIKAKTRELANKHGKHRHAYERRKSPPGFWRTDFPTTQEEAEDREKARVFERDLVQRRYEEAMRSGGKWIFKDQRGGQPGWNK